MARSHPMLVAVILQAIFQLASAGVAQDLIHHRGSDNDALEFTPSEPIIMTPIPNFRPGNTKRDRIAALSLKPHETFHWTASDGTIAEFKFEMPGENENIVNLEAIDDMVREIQCPPPQAPQPYPINNSTSNSTTPTLKIRFAEEADFNSAQDIWKWVNQDQSNHFTLVLSPNACGWNHDRRVLYDVTDLVYNDEAETATLAVHQTTWKDAAHTYDLTIGQLSDLPPSTSSRTKRQITPPSRNPRRRGFWDDLGDLLTGSPSANPDFTIPFSNDFSAQSLSFSSNGLSITALCKTCTSSGSFAVKGRFKAHFFQLQEAWVEVSTSGLSATALMTLTLKGALTAPVGSTTVPIFKFSPLGVSIPGLLTIGPTVGVSLGAEIKAVEGGLALGFGGTARIPASSSRWDFLDAGGTSSVGWEPTFEAEPFTADVLVQASASVFLRAAVGLEISAVETGFAAEMTANIPSLTATIKGIDSLTCTACGNFQYGIQGSLTLGANIGVSLKEKVFGSESTLWGLTFADSSLPDLAGFCQGFGVQGDQCSAV